MTDAPDFELLSEFALNGSEAAFAALVQRHIGLVHSVALRQTPDQQDAHDITQAVFIILARKAGSLGRKTILPGWLYHTARLTAANLQRAETSRFRREQESFMQSTLEETPPDPVWRELAPLLDEAMAQLGETDRDALVLRYFQNKSLPAVGAALGMEERTAQKRVSRALEKLRKYFSKRGVSLSAVAIAGAVSTNSVQSASATLAQTISAVAVAKGAAATTSTVTLVKGVLKIMAWTKMKTAGVACAVMLLAVGTTAVMMRHENRPEPGPMPVVADQPEFPKAAWRFAGYTEPESALESTFWAMSQGDVKAYLESLAPDGGLAKEAQGKSENEIVAMGRGLTGEIIGYRIVDKQYSSDDRVVVTFMPEVEANQATKRPGRIVIRRVGKDWKVSG
jgi:RNA polymerase sigma factor (sigma-70 family)